MPNNTQKTHVIERHFFRALDGINTVVAAEGGAYLHDSHPTALVTFCVLVLKNGSTVIGKSVCETAENFNAEFGRTLAERNALEQLHSTRREQEARAELVAHNGETHSLPQLPAHGGQVYEGTKRLKAWPMSRGTYNAYRGWPDSANEVSTDRGYLVEYLDGGKANDERHVGYISWSPQDVFDKHYREVAEAQ